MDYNASAQFVSSLVKALHSLCNDYVEFESWLQISGTLLMQTDMGKSIEFVIDEKVYKQSELNYALSSLTAAAEKSKQAQETLEFQAAAVEQLEPQANIQELVQAVRNSEPTFQLAFEQSPDEDDNVLYTQTQDQFIKVNKILSPVTFELHKS